MNTLLKRIRCARLWDKSVYFDIVVTKWADLFPSDVEKMVTIVDKLYTPPSDYRKWLKNSS